jgi:hypothetical protein
VREKYCQLIVGGWFVLGEKNCSPVVDKPNEFVDLFNLLFFISV